MTEITDNEARGRYELVEQDLTAYADYRRDEGRLYIDYVFAPPPLRGKGTSDRLMHGVAQAAQEDGMKIVPICGYAATWLRRHREYADLLA
jgi:predicted GNAT family acetyltransferase